MELGSVTLPSGTTVRAVHGSILEYSGDAAVNAANEGGVTGFGVDEMFNRAAGDHEIKDFRRQFGGIPTGTAKYSPSFSHTRVKWIIHAVGPVYRANQATAAKRQQSVEDRDLQLASAWSESVRICQTLGVSRVGFCLLSAGVFRGERSLHDVIAIGLHALAGAVYEGLLEVTVFAYTAEEREALLQQFAAFSSQPTTTQPP